MLQSNAYLRTSGFHLHKTAAVFEEKACIFQSAQRAESKTKTNKQTTHPSAKTSTYILGGIFALTDDFGTTLATLEVNWIVGLVQD